MQSPSGVSVAFVTFLFGVFCAHWAQNTKRSALMWFVLGFLFAPITGLVLLWKNAQPESSAPPSVARDDLMAIRKDLP